MFSHLVLLFKKWYGTTSEPTEARTRRDPFGRAFARMPTGKPLEIAALDRGSDFARSPRSRPFFVDPLAKPVTRIPIAESVPQ